MIYRKYILSHLTKTFALITFAMLSIVILSQFLRFINQYAGKTFELTNILLLLFLILPSIFVQIAPITLFCSIFLVYYTLVTERELIILEVTGVSKFSLAIPAIHFAIIITIMSYLATIFVTPYFKREMRSQQTRIKGNLASSMLEAKVFNTLSKDFTVYIDKQQADQSLQGVIICDQRDKANLVMITAQTAKLISTKNSLTISLYHGNRQYLNANNQLELLFFDSSDFIIQYKKFDKIVHQYSPQELFINELIFIPPDNLRSRNSIHYELHQRLSWPLLNLAVAAIAVCSILSVKYSRYWKYKNAVIGIFAVIVVFLLHFVFANLSENSLFFTIVLYFNLTFTIWLSLYILQHKCNNESLLPSQIKKIILGLAKLNHIR